MPPKILVCQNASCTSLGAANLIRDIEELAHGNCEVEEWGCLGRCGKGPNIELQFGGGRNKVVEGVKTFKKAYGLVTEKADVDVDGNVKKLGQLKYDFRREEDPGARKDKLAKCFAAVGGEAKAAQSEPQLLSELLVLRSKELVKTEVANALKDAQVACQLNGSWAQAKIALGMALDAAGQVTAAVEAMKEALEIGKGINKPAVKRVITRLERKAKERAEAGEQEGPPPEVAPVPAAPAAAAPEAPAPDKAASSEATKKKATGKGKAKARDTKGSAKSKAKPKAEAKKEDAVKEKEIERVARSPLDFLEWRLEEVTDLNHNCVLMKYKSLSLETTSRDPDPGDNPWHVDFLKEGELGQDLKRSYTPISNADAYHKGFLDFMIKIYPDGQMTQHLKTTQTVGSTLLISPPVSTHDISEYKNTIFIAGGSAVTVAIQICQSLLKRRADGHVDLYMCNRTPEDVLYEDIFEDMQTQYSNFQVVHCLSGDVPDGYAGSINKKAVWHKGRLDGKVVKQPKPESKCIVSGPMGLCQAAVHLWAHLGQKEETIHILDELPPADGVDSTTEEVSRVSVEFPKGDVTDFKSSAHARHSMVAEDGSQGVLSQSSRDLENVEVSQTENGESTDGAQAPTKAANKVEAASSGGFLFCSMWRPFWCGGKKADADDSEGPTITVHSA